MRPSSQLRRKAVEAALLAALWLPAAATAQGRPSRAGLEGGPPQSILWVGNSFFYYNESLHTHVGALARSAEPPVRLRGVSVTISGSGLDWHDLAAYLRPGGVGRYAFVGDNEIAFDPPGRKFDAVVMMDCSQCPVHPKLAEAFREAVRKDAQIARREGARPALFMSWAYRDRPEMTGALAEAYTAAGNESDALVIPAGLAFARALSARPGLVLHRPDKRHPTLAGTYLAACTAFAALTGRSPVGNRYTAGLDQEQAVFLQVTAWEAVRAYLDGPPPAEPGGAAGKGP